MRTIYKQSKRKEAVKERSIKNTVVNDMFSFTGLFTIFCLPLKYIISITYILSKRSKR